MIMREEHMINHGGTLTALLVRNPVIGIAVVQKIMETPTHPAALYLKKMKITAEIAVRLNLMSQLSQLPRIPRVKYGKRKGLSEGEKEMNTKERNKEHSKLTRQRRRIYRLCSEAIKTGIPISDHPRPEDRHYHHHQDVDSDSGDDDSFTSDLVNVSDPGIPITSTSPRSVDGVSFIGASSWSVSSLSHSHDSNLPPKKRVYTVSQLPFENVPLIIASPLSSMMSLSQSVNESDQHENKGLDPVSDATSHDDESSMIVDHTTDGGMIHSSMMVDNDTVFEYPNHHTSSHSVTTLPECDSLTSDLSLR